MPYGIIYIKNEKYIFKLDESILSMEKIEDIGGNFMYPEWLANPPYFSDEFLEGLNMDTGKIILFKPHSGKAGFKNTTLHISILYYVELDERAPINRLSVKCAELNFFYDISKCMEKQVFDEEGKVSCHTKNFEETTSTKDCFNLYGKNVELYFTIYRGIKSRDCFPLNLHSIINFVFSETNDYDFLVEICRSLHSFLSFACYRKNIGEFTIELYKKRKERGHQKIGNIYFPINNAILERDNIVKDRHLTYDGIGERIGQIFQDIADDKLYLRHLPESYHDSLKMNSSKFIMITAAIEWIFNNLYPEGIKHRSATVKATEKVKSHLAFKIKESTGKEKELYKFLNRVLISDPLSQKIVQLGKDNDNIFKPIGTFLYCLNSEEDKFEYTQIRKRIETQRNNFAHGNLDKEFDELVGLDILFLERVAYLLQLKAYCSDKDIIMDQVKRLFGMSF